MPYITKLNRILTMYFYWYIITYRAKFMVWQSIKMYFNLLVNFYDTRLVLNCFYFLLSVKFFFLIENIPVPQIKDDFHETLSHYTTRFIYGKIFFEIWRISACILYHYRSVMYNIRNLIFSEFNCWTISKYLQLYILHFIPLKASFTMDHILQFLNLHILVIGTSMAFEFR